MRDTFYARHDVVFMPSSLETDLDDVVSEYFIHHAVFANCDAPDSRK